MKSELNPNHQLLAEALETPANLMILSLRSFGGPSEEQLIAAREFKSQLEKLGNERLLQTASQGLSAKEVRDLAWSIAIAAFLPGGIKLLGKHFEEKLEEFNAYIKS